MKTETIKATHTIDMTPTWAEILGTLVLLIDRGDAKGRESAMTELKRMAHLADCASIIFGAHRRPDAPAIPEAQAIKDRLDVAESVDTRVAIALAAMPSTQIRDSESADVFCVEECEPGLFQSVFPSRIATESALFGSRIGAWQHIIETIE